jgi:hypothetical protein
LLEVKYSEGFAECHQRVGLFDEVLDAEGHDSRPDGVKCRGKKVGVILNKTTSSAVRVNVSNKAADSLGCRKGLSEEPPSKGFEKRGHGFDFPDFL